MRLKPLRFLLGPTASAVLAEAGERAFVVVGRGSYPESEGRFVLWVVPCSVELANKAVRVAKGEAKAVHWLKGDQDARDAGRGAPTREEGQP